MKQNIFGAVLVLLAAGFVIMERHQLTNFGLGCVLAVITLGAMLIDATLVTGWFASVAQLVSAWRQGRRDQQP